MVNSPLIRPYLLRGGSFGEGTLDSHDFYGMVSLRDPFGKVIGDLQRLGMKRSRLESPRARQNLKFMSCLFRFCLQKLSNRIPT